MDFLEALVDGECGTHVRSNYAGGDGEELFETYPFLEVLYPFQAENDFVMSKGLDFLCDKTPSWPVWLSIAYLTFCYVGPKVMQNRKPFDLRTALLGWNLLLAGFSIVGTVRLLPHVIRWFAAHGVRHCLTMEPRVWAGYGPSGLWTQLFIYSKIPELGDTVFIVLRKKPLIFLHWYHHVTVMLYCWHSYYHETPYGVVFAAMNFAVHAIMYLYYALAAMHIKLCPPALITGLQISQMFVGIFVCCSCWYYYLSGEREHLSKPNLWAGVIMYSSYAFLFLQYAARRFFRRHRSGKGVEKPGNGKGATAAVEVDGGGASRNGRSGGESAVRKRTGLRSQG